MLFPETLDFFSMMGQKIDAFCACKQIGDILGLAGLDFRYSHAHSE